MNAEELNRLSERSLITVLGIEFCHGNDGKLEARMPVHEKTRQPFGFLHGGAGIALAETLASAASLADAGPGARVFAGHLDVSHLNPVKDGFVHAKQELIFSNGKRDIRDVHVYSDDGTPISICRITLHIKE